MRCSKCYGMLFVLGDEEKSLHIQHQMKYTRCMVVINNVWGVCVCMDGGTLYDARRLKMLRGIGCLFNTKSQVN